MAVTGKGSPCFGSVEKRSAALIGLPIYLSRPWEVPRYLVPSEQKPPRGVALVTSGIAMTSRFLPPASLRRSCAVVPTIAVLQTTFSGRHYRRRWYVPS